MGPKSGLSKAEVTSKRARELFIGKIPYKLTEQDIEEYFNQHGNVIEVTLLRSSDGRSRGCAFVQMESIDQLDAVMACRPIRLGGQEIECLRAVFGRDPTKTVMSKKLFVGNIGSNTEDELRDYFTKYDTTESVDIPNDRETGKKRNFAVITFVSYEGADKAILEDNHVLGGRSLSTKKYLSKEQEMAVQAKERDLGSRGQRDQGSNYGRGGSSRGGGSMRSRDDFEGGRFGIPNQPSYYGSTSAYGAPRGAPQSASRDREWAASDQFAGSGAGFNSFEPRPAMGGALGSYGQTYGHPSGYSQYVPPAKQEPAPAASQMSGYGSYGIPSAGSNGAPQIPANLPDHQEFRQMLVASRVSQAAVDVLERENLLDPEVLMIMNSSELAELNLPIGDRKRLQLVFQKISASYS